MNFGDRLCQAIAAKKSVAVVGLDPRPNMLPPCFDAEVRHGDARCVAAMRDFCIGLIHAVHAVVPAVKPNIAFFEAYGAEGCAAYRDVCRCAHEAGLLVIGDIKRGDIGSTAEAYAVGHLGLDAFGTMHDAITLNAYLGSDGILPFIEMARTHGQGIFCLVKTSNPSSAELQDCRLEDGRTVAERMAELVDRWGADDCGESGYSLVGAVVGATHGQELCRFRSLMPHTPFLLPGYGAQGASAADIVGAFQHGMGGLVNASRSIMCAYRKTAGVPYTEAARAAAEAMTADLAQALAAGDAP